MEIMSLIGMTVIDPNTMEIIKIEKNELFMFNGVGIEKCMFLERCLNDENIAIPIEYYQFFKVLEEYYEG